jgi:hypothetical protein
MIRQTDYGKGPAYRKVDRKKWDKNYKRIFPRKTKTIKHSR